MLTTDRSDPNLHEEKENGQNKAYLVLSDEELQQGFVRPVRYSYLHIGRKYYGVKPFAEPHVTPTKTYVGTLDVVDAQGNYIGGTYATAEEVDQYNKTGYVGGCGVATTMNETIAKTYARNPGFYGATFCMGCGKHIPVGEFVWADDNSKVGS